MLTGGRGGGPEEGGHKAQASGHKVSKCWAVGYATTADATCESYTVPNTKCFFHFFNLCLNEIMEVH